MAFNGSGVFQRLYNWVNDAGAGIKIRADRMDNEMDGMAVGLSNCITKDGQTTPTSNLKMATYRHTNVGNGSARNDYAALGQVQDGKSNWVASGGTVDAITAAYSPAITTLVDGQLCHFRASGANTSTTPTFSPNGLTARTIVKKGGTALVAGDIPAADAECILRYKAASTRWELLNPASTTVGTSDLEDNSVTLAKMEDGTHGDIYFCGSGGAPTRLGAGSANNVLRSGGADADVSWSAGLIKEDLTALSDGTLAAGDKLVFMDISNSNALALTTSQAVANFGALVHATEQSASSASSLDFTSIPSGVNEIVIVFDNISLPANSRSIFMRIGDSGGYEAAGYTSCAVGAVAGNTPTGERYTDDGDAFVIYPFFAVLASDAYSGRITLTRMADGGNKWVLGGHLIETSENSGNIGAYMIGGTKTLSAELDRLTIYPSTGTFDGGSVNILYK